MANYKTTPNQKVVKVNKEKCDKSNLYATINLKAMEQAAQNLDAGAFKLWIYFSKNQNGHEFALSSKDALETFGLKKKQYDNAVNELIEKGYLNKINGNYYNFNEISVVSKGNNENGEEISVVSKSNNDVVSKRYKDVVSKSNNPLYPKGTRNITDNTYNNTIPARELGNQNQNLSVCQKANLREPDSNFLMMVPEGKEEGTVENPIIADIQWLAERANCLVTINGNKFLYQGKYYMIAETANN